MISIPFDILSLSETWLDETITDGEIVIPWYILERSDRNIHGGGVGVYVSQKLTYTLREDLHNSDLETIWIEVQQTNTKPFLIGTWYRPPDSPSDIINILDTFLEFLTAENK